MPNQTLQHTALCWRVLRMRHSSARIGAVVMHPSRAWRSGHVTANLAQSYTLWR